MPDDSGVSEELSALIWAYVEREAGRDMSLSPEVEVMVRELLLRDRSARALADDFRDVDTGLKYMFHAFGNIPVSDDLMQRIQAQNDAVEPREEMTTDDNVVRFSPRTSKE